ncbi:MAG TPA: hypothetical protein VJR89_25610 [Polyangiales bacterium]|nr:hypothetical protein [Polyangiales bacterium]
MKRLSVLLAAGILLDFASLAESQVPDDCGYKCPLFTPPPGGFGHSKVVNNGEMNGLLWYTMGPHGDWEFGGNVHNFYDYDVDWFGTCMVRSYVGQVFQFSVQGMLQAGQGVPLNPAGRPKLAGRNPEIAAHWEEIAGVDLTTGAHGTWECSIGSSPHEAGGPGPARQTLDDVGKVLGIVNTVISVVAAII